jgi:hypothetical protein
LNFAIAGIVKNEVDGLVEWIAFHSVVGACHFFIADNESDDGTRELLSALSRAGLVTLFDFPTAGEKKPQLPAYAAILRACPADIDVLAFIDADEFILPLEGADSIVPLAERLFASEDVSAVALNWANFGSSGQLFAEEGMVIERFTQRAAQTFGANHHFKSLVRPGRVKSFHNPHYARLQMGRYVDALGRDVIMHAEHGGGLSEKVVWSGARVNHYAVKSLEEFLMGKSRKGSASLHGRVKHKAYFQGHDRNDETCLLAKGFAPRVREEMARLEAMAAPALEEMGRQRAETEQGVRWPKWIESLRGR